MVERRAIREIEMGRREKSAQGMREGVAAVVENALKKPTRGGLE
ncbi:hypothetical protein [Enorma phocaeensis]|nr:hypothetical protein [Enorma phocaeensis]